MSVDVLHQVFALLKPSGRNWFSKSKKEDANVKKQVQTKQEVNVKKETAIATKQAKEAKCAIKVEKLEILRVAAIPTTLLPTLPFKTIEESRRWFPDGANYRYLPFSLSQNALMHVNGETTQTHAQFSAREMAFIVTHDAFWIGEGVHCNLRFHIDFVDFGAVDDNAEKSYFENRPNRFGGFIGVIPVRFTKEQFLERRRHVSATIPELQFVRDCESDIRAEIRSFARHSVARYLRRFCADRFDRFDAIASARASPWTLVHAAGQIDDFATTLDSRLFEEFVLDNLWSSAQEPIRFKALDALLKEKRLNPLYDVQKNEWFTAEVLERKWREQMIRHGDLFSRASSRGLLERVAICTFSNDNRKEKKQGVIRRFGSERCYYDDKNRLLFAVEQGGGDGLLCTKSTFGNKVEIYDRALCALAENGLEFALRSEFGTIVETWYFEQQKEKEEKKEEIDLDDDDDEEYQVLKRCCFESVSGPPDGGTVVLPSAVCDTNFDDFDRFSAKKDSDEIMILCPRDVVTFMHNDIGAKSYYMSVTHLQYNGKTRQQVNFIEYPTRFSSVVIDLLHRKNNHIVAYKKAMCYKRSGTMSASSSTDDVPKTRCVITLAIENSVIVTKEPLHGKCRTNRARVMCIEECTDNTQIALDANGDSVKNLAAFSLHDATFRYVVGEDVFVPQFQDNDEECAPGIHFFFDKKDALKYA